MYKVQIGKSNFNVPESVRDLTLGQLLDLRAAPATDTVGRMAIILRVEKDELLNLEATDKVTKQFAKAVALTQSVNESIREYFASDYKFDTPKTVKLLGTEITVKKDIGKLPMGAFLQVKAIIYDVIAASGTGIAFDPTDRTADIIAHYLYVPVMEALNQVEIPGMPANIGLSTEKIKVSYDADKADEFKAVVRDMPLIQAIPLGNFFFLKHKRYYLNTVGRLLTSLLQTKLKLKLKYSKHSGILTS